MHLKEKEAFLSRHRIIKLQNTEREKKRKEWGIRERRRVPKSSREEGKVICKGMKFRLTRGLPTTTITKITRSWNSIFKVLRKNNSTKTPILIEILFKMR